MSNKALVLLSGGPDSATLAKWARANGFEDTHHVFLSTGHEQDKPAIEMADFISSELKAPLEFIDIAPLIEASIMPFGNAIALSIAVTYAKKIKANKILMAIHADDAAESVEYRRPFFDSIQNLAQSCLGDIEIMTPFIDISRSEVFTEGLNLDVNFAKTWSCIRESEKHRGYCGACRARARVFKTCQTSDLTDYSRHVVAIESAASH